MTEGHSEQAPGHERRASTRRPADTPIRYRTARMEEFAHGSLINISDSGVLISVDQVLALNTRVYFIIETANTRQDNLHVIAVVVRKRVRKGGAADYGCEIIKTSTRPLPPIWDSKLPEHWEEVTDDRK